MANDESGLKVCECDSGLLDPEEQYHLPRSSPVISRKRHKTETEILPDLTLIPLTLKLSISPMVKSTSSGPLSENEKHFDHCNSPKGSSQLTQLLTDNCGTGISFVSQYIQLYNHSLHSGLLHHGFQAEIKRRACSDIPLASGQRSSDQTKKIVSCVDVHSTEDLSSLDQENAHFAVVDMVLEVLEAVKWFMCLQQLKDTHPHQDFCEVCNTSNTDSVSSSDSGFEGESTCKLSSNRCSLASFQSSLQISRMQSSAEGLAHRLLSEFRKQWFTSELL